MSQERIIAYRQFLQQSPSDLLAERTEQSLGMDWLLNLIQLADEIKKYAQLNNPDSVELIAYQHETRLKEQSKPSYATVKVLGDELDDYAAPNEMPLAPSG